MLEWAAIFPVRTVRGNGLRDPEIARQLSDRLRELGGQVFRVWPGLSLDEPDYLVLREKPNPEQLTELIEEFGLTWARTWPGNDRDPQLIPLNVGYPDITENEGWEILERLVPENTPEGLSEWIARMDSYREEFVRTTEGFAFFLQAVNAFICCGGLYKHRPNCQTVNLMSGAAETPLANTPPSEARPDSILQSFPRPYGEALATEGAASVAGPMLAGFAFALLGLILQASDKLRFANLTLALFVLAGLAFITVVQLGFAARRHYISPSDLTSLLDLAQTEDEKRALEQDYRSVLTQYWSRARWIRRAYNLGIVVLLVAVALMLIPPGPLESWRKVAIGIAILGVLVEIAWALVGWSRAFVRWAENREIRQRLPPQ